MEKDYLLLSQILRDRRIELGYSQRSLARVVGVHHSTINDYENGFKRKGTAGGGRAGKRIPRGAVFAGVRPRQGIRAVDLHPALRPVHRREGQHRHQGPVCKIYQPCGLRQRPAGGDGTDD